MDKLEALTALLDKAKADDFGPADSWIIQKALGDWAGAYRTVQLVSWIMSGTIEAEGAAKALHEAVLPGWVYGINFDAHKELYAFVGDGSVFETDACYAETPARAWLLAILEALISQETKP
jgi:hypothetical protein